MLALQTPQSDFWTALWATPSPWVGGVLGGLITGGIFGWVAYLRTIRPTLIFFRRQEGNERIWRLKNVGQGVAAYVRIHDIGADKQKIEGRVRTYPIGQGEERKLVWIKAGGKLEALYTDVYGRRWYRTVCDENENQFHRQWRAFWCRPDISKIRAYRQEIDAILEHERSKKE